MAVGGGQLPQPQTFGTVRLVGGESMVSRRVAFSRDSKILFCCCGQRIRVYSTVTGELLRELNGHENNVTDLKLSPTNHLQLVSSSSDGTIIVWDYTDASILQKHTFEINVEGFLLHAAHNGSIFLIEGTKPSVEEQISKKKSKTYRLGVLSTKDLKEKEPKFEVLLDNCGNGKQSTISGKGDLIASVKSNCLYLWVFKSKKSRQFSYSDKKFTCASFHPYEACVAAGDKLGRIILWQGVDQLEDPVTTVLHWHSHAVADIVFTFDGSSILSGGMESVLVLWQYKTHHRQFLPRLGAKITCITVSPDDSLIAVCQNDNVIRLLSNIVWQVKQTIQGMRQMASPEVGTFDPRSRALVMNSMPGILQFYLPQNNHHAYFLDVVKQNYITQTELGKLYLADVTHVAFNNDGSWLVTVDRRDDKQYAVEMRLKFWEYNKISQCYCLNTCVDKSHSSKTVALQFQPKLGETTFVPLVMVASTDGKFEIWILTEEGHLEDERHLWSCRSVGYYGNMPCQDASFSQDGSVLAVAYSQTITLWTPDTIELRKTLSLPYPDEEIKMIKFGNNDSSQYLIASTDSYLTVWNLLSCSVSWSVEAYVTNLVADPRTNLIHVFLCFSKSKSKPHLYVFDPATPCPVAVHSNVLKAAPLMAAFDPGSALSRIAEGSTHQMSKLYFLNCLQELYTLDCVEPEIDKSSAVEDQEEEPLEQQSDFLKVLGPSVRSKGESTSVPHTGKTVHGTPSSAVVRQMLSTPSHVLPSVSSFCSTFLQSLLVSRQPSQRNEVHDEDDSEGEEDESMEIEEDSETEETPVTYGKPVQSQNSAVSERRFINTEEQTDVEKVNFSWLKEFFTTM